MSEGFNEGDTSFRRESLACFDSQPESPSICCPKGDRIDPSEGSSSKKGDIQRRVKSGELILIRTGAQKPKNPILPISAVPATPVESNGALNGKTEISGVTREVESENVARPVEVVAAPAPVSPAKGGTRGGPDINIPELLVRIAQPIDRSRGVDVPTRDIKLLDDLQIRAGGQEAEDTRAKELRETSPRSLPAIVLAQCGKDPGLNGAIIDGRLSYLVLAEDHPETMKCVRLPVKNREEAIVWRFKLNSQHGLMLTRQERKAFALNLYRLGFTQAQAAQLTGINQRTVGRASEEETPEDQHKATRTRRDPNGAHPGREAWRWMVTIKSELQTADKPDVVAAKMRELAYAILRRYPEAAEAQDDAAPEEGVAEDSKDGIQESVAPDASEDSSHEPEKRNLKKAALRKQGKARGR